MSIVVMLGLFITGVYRGVNKFVIDKSSMPVVELKKKDKPKLSMEQQANSSRRARRFGLILIPMR
ncbi:unnamed protein product, partial [Urochloa humidicola]